jgi:hypothetical protein
MKNTSVKMTLQKMPHDPIYMIAKLRGAITVRDTTNRIDLTVGSTITETEAVDFNQRYDVTVVPGKTYRR